MPSSNSRNSGVIDLEQGQARTLRAPKTLSHTGNNHSAGSKIRYSLAVWSNPGTVCRTSGSWERTCKTRLNAEVPFDATTTSHSS